MKTLKELTEEGYKSLGTFPSMMAKVIDGRIDVYKCDLLGNFNMVYSGKYEDFKKTFNHFI